MGLRPSKKLGCDAHVNVHEIVKFPSFKSLKIKVITDVVTMTDGEGERHFANVITSDLNICWIGVCVSKVGLLTLNSFKALVNARRRETNGVTTYIGVEEETQVMATSSFTFPQKLVDEFMHAAVVPIPEILKSASKRRCSVSGTVTDIRGTKQGPNWRRKDMEVADTEGHRLWIKLWGDKIQQTANVTLGDHITVENCLVGKYRDLTSVSSTDVTDVKIERPMASGTKFVLDGHVENGPHYTLLDVDGIVHRATLAAFDSSGISVDDYPVAVNCDVENDVIVAIRRGDEFDVDQLLDDQL